MDYQRRQNPFSSFCLNKMFSRQIPSLNFLTNFSARIARDEKILLLKKNPSDTEGRSAAGLPDFFVHHTRTRKSISNDNEIYIPNRHKIYQMAVKYMYQHNPFQGARI
jgi:hypothetical protein